MKIRTVKKFRLQCNCVNKGCQIRLMEHENLNLITHLEEASNVLRNENVCSLDENSPDDNQIAKYGAVGDRLK